MPKCTPTLPLNSRVEAIFLGDLMGHVPYMEHVKGSLARDILITFESMEALWFVWYQQEKLTPCTLPRTSTKFGILRVLTTIVVTSCLGVRTTEKTIHRLDIDVVLLQPSSHWGDSLSPPKMSCPNNPRLDPPMVSGEGEPVFFTVVFGGVPQNDAIFGGVRILRVVKHVLNKPSMLPDPTRSKWCTESMQGEILYRSPESSGTSN